MENRKELAIVSCCNTNFVPHLAAMFVSILKNSPSAAAVHFYVIDDNINFESKQLLYFTIKHTQINAELTFLKINPHFFKNVVTSERIPKQPIIELQFQSYLEAAILTGFYIWIVT